MVDNYLPGPSLVVAPSQVGVNHVNLIIDGHVMAVSVRELANVLAMVLKRNENPNDLVIVTPDMQVTH